MAYVKNNWVDREGTTRYFETVDSDGAKIFTPDYTQVTELGTPVNADNMNHIEEGIAAGSFTKYDSMATYAKNDLVTTILDNELKVYKSLQDNNTGELSGSTWEEVEFSGSGGAGLQMFDPIIKDHVLTYEESKGLALQGSYVYKEAIAGSRYGYPDFYAKCLEEKEAGTATEVTLGDSVITMYINSNGHQFYDIADKDAVDTWFETYGTAWFYGIDTENERVFLPRNNYFEQLTVDVSEVGQSVKAGLPNITGAWIVDGTDGNSYSGGAFSAGKLSSNGAGKGHNSNQGGAAQGFTFDASISSPIYGNSDTVQPNAVKKLLYICVGNTESQSVITDVVDVTTTENDTIPLLTGMYFDFTPNNLSWLKGGQQANNAGIYKTCYNELVNVLNGETKYGDLKVVDMANMISGIDYSEYWKVNQDEMYFVTPTTISNKALSGAVKGNGLALGLTDGTNEGGLATSTISTYGLFGNTGSAGNAVGSSPASAEFPALKLAGIVTDSSKSGIVAEESTAQLYFKVANAVQNLELLDVGKVMEAVADKISHQDCKAYIVETYVNGTSGYNVYSNKWCEQWGETPAVSPDAQQTITFLKPFANTNYYFNRSCILKNSSGTSVGYFTGYFYKTATSVTIQSSTYSDVTSWFASGYIA